MYLCVYIFHSTKKIKEKHGHENKIRILTEREGEGGKETYSWETSIELLPHGVKLC
jgi:hypothetical protein